jgi:RHS repeat-associated protein
LRSFAYDDENQLIQVWVPGQWFSQFTYDGKMRRRIRQEYTWSSAIGNWSLTNEVRYVYDGNLVIQERDINNLPTTTYTRGKDLSGSLEGAGGIGGLLARSDTLSAVASGAGGSFYHADGNGNITMLINSSQAIVAKYLYDAFGNVMSKSGLLADANLYRFSSKEAHLNSGLVYYLYRYYDPNLQRWPNRDPIAEKGGLNLYTFNWNDSVGKVDTYGDTFFDLYRKLRGLQVPKAISVQAGGFFAAKIPGLSGILGGANTTVMFFPDSCEVGAYSVTAGALTGWQGGVAISLGGGTEFAVYSRDPTPGHANAASYAGPFYTLQMGSAVLGLADFISFPNNYGGYWFGFDISVGAGGGVAINEWDYSLVGSVTLPKCLCDAAILVMP